MQRNGTIFIVYADDINIMGLTKWDVIAGLNAIERESTKIELVVNESKTNYMLSTSRDVRRSDP